MTPILTTLLILAGVAFVLTAIVWFVLTTLAAAYLVGRVAYCAGGSVGHVTSWHHPDEVSLWNRSMTN